MVPARYALVALALAAAAGLTASFVLGVFARTEPLMGWEDALELRRALSAGRASLTFNAYARELPLTVNATLDGRQYSLQLSRVLIYFKARSAPGSPQAPFEEPLKQLWRAWGNGTHAGAASLLDISDDGSTIRITFLALSSQLKSDTRGSSFCVSAPEALPYFLSSSQGGNVSAGGAVYAWRGRREVRVQVAKLTACGDISSGVEAPSPVYRLSVQVLRVGRNGSVLGAAAGAKVTVGGAVYTADSSGVVSLQVSPGLYSVEVLQVELDGGWRRYVFQAWWDGVPLNPRTFAVSSDTTLTAYVRDERKLLATCSGGGYVKVNGAPAGCHFEDWLPLGSTVNLTAEPLAGYSFVEWQRAVNGGQLSRYSSSSTVLLRVDSGYWLHAIFNASQSGQAVGNRTLTFMLLRVTDAGGQFRVLGGAAGARVKVNGTVYTADANGVVRVSVPLGTYVVEVLQSTGSEWLRYTFYTWLDGSTSNPRVIRASWDFTFSAYVWDERKVAASYSSGGYLTDTSGNQIPSGWSSWFRYGYATGFCAVTQQDYYLDKWLLSVNGGPLQEAWSNQTRCVNVNVDNGYLVRADFILLYTFAFELWRVDYSGRELSSIAAVVLVNGTSYNVSRFSVRVKPGAKFTVEFPQQTFSGGWGRYTFWKWSDGSTANPRTFTITSTSTFKLLAWDERKLTATYSVGGYVKVNGQQVANGTAVWLKYGSTAQLEAVSVYKALDKWLLSVNGGPLQVYSARQVLERRTASGQVGNCPSLPQYLEVCSSNTYDQNVEVSAGYTAASPRYTSGTNWYLRIYDYWNPYWSKVTLKEGRYDATTTTWGLVWYGNPRTAGGRAQIPKVCAWLWLETDWYDNCCSGSLVLTIALPAQYSFTLTVDEGYWVHASFDF